ncbi:Myotubularin-related protein 6 [Cricetulus griseus]|uniref:Myotubularin-related protein 6 n=1 Tax=Cricetulus griseus TaxID=10029 RepID=G3H8R8_CRIGR|nr:Myotubularin-related protein 6 [Cricetulus griseus]
MEHIRTTKILHHHIASVEKLALTTSGCPLVIQCKNFRIVHFIVPRERDCHDIYNSLLQLSKQGKYEDLYAFSYNPKQNDSERLKGWEIIDLAKEYERMGVPNGKWKLCDANREYKVCETYPRELYVPKSAILPMIMGSSNFRSKGRLPVLSYCRQGTEAAICRCSQPLSGFSARCLEDEKLLKAISTANSGNHYMYVVDTRPKKITQCKNGLLTKDLLHVHPESPALKTSLSLKEQSLLPVNDTLRAIEGSNPPDNRYCDYPEEFSKSEPTVVSLEYGVARMTC